MALLYDKEVGVGNILARRRVPCGKHSHDKGGADCAATTAIGGPRAADASTVTHGIQSNDGLTFDVNDLRIAVQARTTLGA